ncbi:msl8686 [Mesorhizobium japonicum MAFF 303099]|uniref:Msl8686 protein n=1 Tax=Mesorhizobium japonicum (strain LMG 29417 / CECT 9101 / MAFF 303099) TaxID=266835 RepID=Q98A89_RHILO|nr:msl8686 [Mesorhizobium japonicum MAFF 303099]
MITSAARHGNAARSNESVSADNAFSAMSGRTCGHWRKHQKTAASRLNEPAKKEPPLREIERRSHHFYLEPPFCKFCLLKREPAVTLEGRIAP